MCTDYAVFQHWIILETRDWLPDWPAGPSPLTYTYEAYIGDPQEEIVGAVVRGQPAVFELPALDPDEFESVYLWFLA